MLAIFRRGRTPVRPAHLSILRDAQGRVPYGTNKFPVNKNCYNLKHAEKSEVSVFMSTYALLKNPSYTRVSFQDSNKLAQNELALMGSSFSNFSNIRYENESIGGVPFLLFDYSGTLTDEDIVLLSRLSFVYAIFKVEKTYLLPIHKNPAYFMGEDLSGILKYSGKTNELFTRLMLNLAIKHVSQSHPLNILDPLAGKGTTLFEALMQNHNAYGIEIDSKTTQESYTYLKKYLETARYKHTTHTEKTSFQSEQQKQKITAIRYQIGLSPSKKAEKEGNIRHFEILAGDTRFVANYFKKNFFHVIIADLPYGVQHGSKEVRKEGNKEGSKELCKKPQSITRNALGLASESLPGWIKTLKTGGVIALAWNLFLISRSEMVELLSKHGLTVLENIQEYDFSHRVDQAIDRDIIIARL